MPKKMSEEGCDILKEDCMKAGANRLKPDVINLYKKCFGEDPPKSFTRENLCNAIVNRTGTFTGGPAPVSPAASIARSATSTTSTIKIPDDIRDFILPPLENSKLTKDVLTTINEKYNLGVKIRAGQTRPLIYSNIEDALNIKKSGKTETTTSSTKKPDFFDDLLGGPKPTIAVKPSIKILSKSEEEEEDLKRQLAQKQKARKEREEKEKADREKAARDAALAKVREKKEEQEREKARMLKEQEELRKKAMPEEAANRTQVLSKMKAEADIEEIKEKPSTIAVSTSGGKGLDVATKKSYSVESKDFKTIVFEIIDDLGSYSEILNNYKDESSGDINFSKLRQDLTKVIANNKTLENFKKDLISKIKDKILSYLQQKKVKEEKVVEVVEPTDPLTQKIVELVNTDYSGLSDDTDIITNIIQELNEYIKDPKLLKEFFDQIVKTNVTTNTITFDDDVIVEIIDQQLYTEEETTISTELIPELIPVSVATQEVPMLEPARRLKSPLNRRQKYSLASTNIKYNDNCYPEYGLNCPEDLFCDIDNNPPTCVTKLYANNKITNIKNTEIYSSGKNKIIGNRDTINTLKRNLKSDLPGKDYKHGTYEIIDNLINANIENNILDKDIIFNNVFTSLESTGEFTPEQLVSNKLKYYVKRMINLLVSEKEIGEVVVSEPAPIVGDIDSIIQKYKDYTSENVIFNKVKKDLSNLGIEIDSNILREKIQNMLAIKEAEEAEEAEAEEEEEEEEEEEVLPIPDRLPIISTEEIIEGKMLSTLLDKTDDESSDRQRQIRLAQNAVIKCLGLVA